jgi:hypothetical protein
LYESVEDINGDGNNELIVDQIFASSNGVNHCIGTWPVVYAWNGTGYANVGTEFKGFYRKTLTELKRQITPQLSPTPASEQQVITEGELTGPNGARVRARSIRPEAIPAPAPDAGDSDCQKAEAAKIERFLGISRDAGIEDAIKWAESDDPTTPQFGGTVLADIGTAKAIRYLRTLGNDPDPNVASSGKEGLKYLTTNSRPIANPTIQGELLTPDIAKSQPK